MPIGKDSISRVKKNGYANITSAAPDMEDSKIATKSVKQKAKATPVKKDAAPLVKTPAKMPAKKRTYFKIGDKLPIYLL